MVFFKHLGTGEENKCSCILNGTSGEKKGYVIYSAFSCIQLFFHNMFCWDGVLVCKFFGLIEGFQLCS